MEKLTRALALLTLVMATMTLHGQGIHAGMLRAQGTLAAGLLNRSEEIRFYVYGELEYLMDDHIGFNGAIYGQMGSSKDEFGPAYAPGGGDFYTHSVFAGPIYHFRKDTPLDLYAGIQPGLHLTRTPDILFPDGAQIPAAWEVSPSASIEIGMAYYGSFFHVFGQLRALTGQSLKAGSSYGIGEIRPTFGLGFNIF